MDFDPRVKRGLIKILHGENILERELVAIQNLWSKSHDMDYIAHLILAWNIIGKSISTHEKIQNYMTFIEDIGCDIDDAMTEDDILSFQYHQISALYDLFEHEKVMLTGRLPSSQSPMLSYFLWLIITPYHVDFATLQSNARLSFEHARTSLKNAHFIQNDQNAEYAWFALYRSLIDIT